MVDVILIRPGAGAPRLIPASRADLDALQKLRADTPCSATIKFPRSLPHQRWYRALVSVVADAIGVHHDALHADLKFKAGLVSRLYLGPKGTPIVELKSTAFADMDESEFTEYRVIAVALLFRDYLPGVKKRSVWERVEQMVGPCPW